MTAILIKDLPAAETLDSKAMHAVRGGMLRGFAPVWAPYFSAYSSEVSVEASQLIGQTQNVSNTNGNNVAFAQDIRSIVKPNQSATNNIILS
jgi:hypothetical protein